MGNYLNNMGPMKDFTVQERGDQSLPQYRADVVRANAAHYQKNVAMTASRADKSHSWVIWLAIFFLIVFVVYVAYIEPRNRDSEST
jgi:t-SNARE complex subunit (syntaxin)